MVLTFKNEALWKLFSSFNEFELFILSNVNFSSWYIHNICYINDILRIIEKISEIETLVQTNFLLTHVSPLPDLHCHSAISDSATFVQFKKSNEAFKIACNPHALTVSACAYIFEK